MSKYQFVLVKSNSLIKPSPRSGHRCVTDDTYLYVFGGFNPGTTKKLFSEIWCFNLSLQTWHKLETSGPSPTCVASSTVVLRRGKLVIFGGSGYPFGSNNSNRTYVCDLRMRKWKELSIGSTSNDTPEESYGQCGVIGPDNCMYVFGGTKGLEYNNNLHKMNLDSYSWEWIRCRIVPSPRYRHEAVSIDDAFLVIGGYGQNGACTLEKVYMFKYDQNVWKEVKCLPYNDSEFPKPRRAHSCIRYKKNVYVCGGYTEVQSDVDESCAYDDVWKLDLKTFCWQRINQVLPFPRFFHSASVTSEGCMYIFGGVQQIDSHCLERTNTLYKMWLVIPTLQELCWEIVCSTFPVSTELGKKNLARLGVPRHLLARCETEHLGF